ncbi:MAG: peptide-methionine (R)-S-oxide reductase [Pseudomonadota bacterium]
MTQSDLNRRAFMGGTAVAALAVADTQRAIASNDTAVDNEEFVYEITRTDAEWRERLTEAEFDILRGGATEARFTSPFVEQTTEGSYSCKGCDLTLYDSLWKVQLDIGWVFFRHSEPKSVLTGIDGEPFVDGVDIRNIVQMSVECRRCGSHLGHIVHAQGELVHCINGTSLTFRAAEA